MDRLVHHATILELNVESYRRKSAERAKEKNSRRKTDDNYRRQLTISHHTASGQNS